MDSNFKSRFTILYSIIGILIIAVIILAVFMFSNGGQKQTGEAIREERQDVEKEIIPIANNEDSVPSKEELAKCLTQKGIVFYTDTGNIFAKQVLNYFDEANKYLTVQYCGDSLMDVSDFCVAMLGGKEEFRSLPTWRKPNGEMLHGGEQNDSLLRIREFSDC